MTTADVGWLYRLGLHRPELRAWALYDWANSAFATTVMGALIGPYFKAVPAGHLPAIREGLKHGNWQVRRWCAIFLDHHSDEKSLQSLVPLLRDPKRQVRLWASAKVGARAGSKIAMGASAVTAPRGDRRWPRAGSR